MKLGHSNSTTRYEDIGSDPDDVPARQSHDDDDDGGGGDDRDNSDEISEDSRSESGYISSSSSSTSSISSMANSSRVTSSLRHRQNINGGDDEEEDGEGRDGMLQSVFDSARTYLRAWDLNPQPMPLPKRARSQWGGFLHLLYLPFLLGYLMWIVSPIYGPLPSCCACATTPSNANNSWIYLGMNSSCQNDNECRDTTQKFLSQICTQLLDVSLQLQPPDGIAVNYQEVVCYGDIPGEPCSDSCRSTSDRWLSAVDYTSPLNLRQAGNVCPVVEGVGQPAGVCQFMALWYNPDAQIFPQGVCRYTSVRGLLAQFGAALGLISGLFVTIRSITRAAWTQLERKREPLGRWASYAWGFSSTVVLSYLAWSYFLLAPRHVSKMSRYGSQTAMGFLLLFACSPMVVFCVYIFSEMWPAILLTALLRISAVALILTTTYSIIVCDLDRNQRQIRRSLYASAQESRLHLILLFVFGFVFSVFALIGVVVRNRTQPVPSARRAAIWRGANAGAVFLALVVLWIVLSTLNLWDVVVFDLPVSLSTTTHLSHRLNESLIQSCYSLLSYACIMIISFIVCAFFRELPKTRASEVRSPLPLGSRAQWRLSFVASVTPAFAAMGYFLAFSYFSFQVQDPQTRENCRFPWFPVISAMCCILPSLFLWLLGSSIRIRSGAFSGFGFNVVALGEAIWILSFDFCIGPSRWYLFIIIWFIQLTGSLSLIFGVFAMQAQLRLAKEYEFVQDALDSDSKGRVRARAQSILSIISGETDYRPPTALLYPSSFPTTTPTESQPLLPSETQKES